jgi:chromosome segregation ATPase
VTDEQFEVKWSTLMRELAEFRGAVIGELGKLARKHDETRAAVDRIAERQFEREHEENRYRRRLKAAETELERLSTLADGPNWQRDPRDVTGVHQVRELQEWRKQEEARRHDSGIWWKRQRWLWTIGIVIALGTASVIGCAGWVSQNLEVRKK